MGVSLSKIPRAFHLPRVHWDLVRDWVEQNVPVAERTRAWSTLAHDWLESMDQALGGAYRTIHSDKVILFAPDDLEEAVSLFDLSESSLQEMSALLGRLARQSQTGPLVIILFGDDDAYCRYVSPFDPLMESVRSGGVCIRQDYVHVVLRPQPLDNLQRTMLHEIAHACLSDHHLPEWLEEGITQLAEEAAVAPWARFSLKPKEIADLRKYWREHSLSQFWWGSGFHTPDEGQRHCYELAQAIFRQLVADHQEKLPEFLAAASAEDAGASAAEEILGVDLSNLAAQFLGAGSWKPVPAHSDQFIARGAYFLEQGHIAKAFSDFDRAIELNKGSSQAYFHRGVAFYQIGQIAKCISDYERSIALNSVDFNARNNLAWILATSPQDEFRNGKRAVEIATEACERVGYSQWFCLGTLAAAYAEKGEFELACNFAEEALEHAPSTDVADCKVRLQQYKTGKPWRELKPGAPYRNA
ncbi:hypothetical protein [Schlesneria sp.]|uniref:tetratricopeptide repeat protein n=1 Tax=Schlesneria sp. TaxID=2762018 RepID=UPI002F0760E1